MCCPVGQPLGLLAKMHHIMKMLGLIIMNRDVLGQQFMSWGICGCAAAASCALSAHGQQAMANAAGVQVVLAVIKAPTAGEAKNANKH